MAAVSISAGRAAVGDPAVAERASIESLASAPVPAEPIDDFLPRGVVLTWRQRRFPDSTPPPALGVVADQNDQAGADQERRTRSSAAYGTVPSTKYVTAKPVPT